MLFGRPPRETQAAFGVCSPTCGASGAEEANCRGESSMPNNMDPTAAQLDPHPRWQEVEGAHIKRCFKQISS